MEEAKKIQEGFNKGYLLKKHNPSLSLILERGLKENQDPYSKGLLAGIKEYDSEKTPSKHKNFDISRIRRPNISKSKDKDMDKDM